MKIILSGYGKMNKALEKLLYSHQLFIVSPETGLDFKEINEEVDIIIDFSFHKVIHVISEYLENKKNIKLIIGTTGYTNDELEIIEKISKNHVVVMSSNFSKGINMFFSMVKKLAEYNLDGYNIYLLEKHHKYKVDSPSGTSKTIKELVDKPIKIECIKNGDIIGEHTLDIYLENERLSISHTAYSRNVFCQGVVDILDSLVNLKPGFYSLEDLNLWKEKK